MTGRVGAPAAAGTASAASVLAPVQMFWFGRPFGEIERLSVLSFLHHGHDVHLYSYATVHGVPREVTSRDAAEVMPRVRFDTLISQGARPGPVSDVFRYLLLHTRGGWWVDCDVVCVQPWDLTADIVFGWQDERVVNQAVLRLPAGHDAAARLSTLTTHPNRWMRGDPPRRIARKTRDTVLGRRTPAAVPWGATGPAAVTTVVTGLRLLHHGLPPEAFYPVPWERSAVLFEPGELGLGSLTYAVHLWNEVRGGRPVAPGSPVHRWMETHHA